VQNRGAGVGSRSVTCKGHAESGTTCRGKAPRIAKASSASRRAEWKRSGGPRGFLPPLTTRKMARDFGREATGVSEVGRSFSDFVIGTNTPARTGTIRRSDSGVVKRSIPRSDGRDARGHRCTQDARETECFDDEPGAGEYGCSLVECWVAEIGQTHLTIVNLGESQDEPSCTT
jgi:hypothetical protein